MDVVSPGCISPGDIVLLECTVVRTEALNGLIRAAFVFDALHWLVEQPTNALDTEEGSLAFPAIILAE